jgi:type VII secretion integral membrane protein EccD
VALPADVPLADILPAVLPQFGAEWVERGSDHEGWVVQRVGQPPLEEDRTAAELSLFDGETVYVRPRADQLAKIDYDDLVDGVGEQVRDHTWSWSVERSRWTFRAGAAVTLLVGLLLVLGQGSAAQQTFIAGVFAVVLLAAAALAARGAADAPVATILTSVGVCYAAVAGWLLVGTLDPGATAAMRLAGLSVTTLLALACSIMVLASPAYGFAGATLFFTVLALTGVIGSVSALSLAQTAAIGLVLSLVIGVFVPSAAFRLSGLTLPSLPTAAEELGEDIEPIPHRRVTDLGAVTIGYSIGLFTGLGAAQTILLPVVVSGGGVWPVALALVIAATLLLRSRHPDGTAQRWAILVPAVVAIATTVLQVGAQLGSAVRLLLVFPSVFAVGLLLLLGGKRLPGRRLRPYWARTGEILESISAIAAIPILLQVLGTYAAMRGLAG